MAKNNEKFVSRENAKTLWGYMVDLLTGKYTKPSGGIPKSDLESAVQTSLGLADSALQGETDPTVPSWAKQTNKPSYTQDEVGDGTTYKRVTQTEKDTWSGKQNALTTTQMQAVNSGITSEKVGQINTNQSNILLLESMNGEKNKINFTLDWYKRSDLYNSEGTWSANVYTVANVGTVTVNSDSTLTFKKTSSSTRLIFRIVPMSEGLNYVGDWMFGCPAGGGNNTFRLICEQAETPWGNRGTDGGSGSAIGASTVPLYMYIVLDPGYTTPTEGIVFKPMIISAEAKNAGFTDYKPYALPNTVITPALIEQVDGEAKNLFELSKCTLTSGDSTLTYTVSGNEINVSATSKNSVRTIDIVGFNVPVKVPIVVSGCPAGGSDQTYAISVVNSGSVMQVWDYGIGSAPFMFTTTSNSYLRIRVAANASFSNKVFKIMICTLADWKVSQKFVPYRVPITGVMSVVDKEVACSTTLTTTGIKFTATEKAAYRITATAIYYNSIPWKLAIKYKISSSSNQGTLCTVTHVDGEDVSLTVSGIRLLDVGGEFEIFAQYANSTNNRFYVLVEKIG